MAYSAFQGSAFQRSAFQILDNGVTPPQPEVGYGGGGRKRHVDLKDVPNLWKELKRTEKAIRKCRKELEEESTKLHREVLRAREFGNPKFPMLDDPIGQQKRIEAIVHNREYLCEVIGEWETKAAKIRAMIEEDDEELLNILWI